MRCPTRCVIRSISIFFALMFFAFFVGFVVDAADGGSPRRILHSMLICECAAGFFALVAANTNPRKVD